ncbi:MAG: ABC transporter substrate-binding protein [Thermomicrobiaceae bacterium]
MLVTLASLMLAVILVGCDALSSDDTLDNVTPTPDANEVDVPDQPEESGPDPEAVTEEQKDGWTILTGRDRSDPPENRTGNQVLRMAGPTDVPTTIDPALSRDTESAFLAKQVFRGLVRLDANLEPVPDLATQIEIAPEGRLYRFILHDGVTFHDGTALTADAVRSSFERATDPDLVGGNGEELPSRNYLDDIEGARERMDGEREDIPGISVVDDLTLEISLERGVVDFLERLANTSSLIVDAEQAAEDGENWWQEPNGSGPVMLTEWDPERQIELSAHDGYVAPPLLSTVEIRVGAEATGRMQLYETEQIDVVNVGLSVLDRVEYEGSPIRGDLREQQLLSTSFVLMNPTIPPFDDPAVREALMHTFPRDQITNIMLDGRVRVAQGVLPPEMDHSEVSPFPFGHDPERASSRFGERQSGDVDQITIYSSGGSIPVAMKHFIEEELELEVEVVQLRWADYMSDMEEGRLAMFVLSWVADGPDAVSFLQSLFHSESPDNYARFSDPEVDELIDQAAVEQNQEERRSLIQQAHERILESSVVMPLYHTVDYILVDDTVRGLETTPMGILGLETVWIDD